jgi:putative membrane protein
LLFHILFGKNSMKSKSTIFVFCSLIAIGSIPASSLPTPSEISPTVDRTFVGKVSQGGLYEVEASRIAEEKGTSQDVRDMAIAEVHDHDLVNHELKRIAMSAGIAVSSQLNAEFQQRLSKLKLASGPAFNTAYVTDMAQIHDMDEKLFAKEAIEGTDNLKIFAANTDRIVKRHIGAIHGTDTP